MRQGAHRTVLLVLVVLSWGCSPPKDILIGVDAPLTAHRGDDFVIVATVTNTASKAQRLVSLDIGDAYLDGIAIVRTEPDHREATHVPIDDTMSYVFKIPVEPGKSVTIRLFAKALKQGDFHSEIDFCINSDYRFLSKSIRTVVD